jgi:hypothetical protein
MPGVGVKLLNNLPSCLSHSCVLGFGLDILMSGGGLVADSVRDSSGFLLTTLNDKLTWRLWYEGKQAGQYDRRNVPYERTSDPVHIDV